MTNSFTDDINDNFESVKPEIESIKTNYTPLQVTNAINTTIANIPSKTSDLTNDSGFITGITTSDVTTALGYTPTSPANVDGQWEPKSQDFTISKNVTSSPQELNLRTLDYLPANTTDYNFEVLVSCKLEQTGTSPSYMHILSDVVGEPLVLTCKEGSRFQTVTFAIPVYNTVSVQITRANATGAEFRAIAYRRLGTNT